MAWQRYKAAMRMPVLPTIAHVGYRQRENKWPPFESNKKEWMPLGRPTEDVEELWMKRWSKECLGGEYSRVTSVHNLMNTNSTILLGKQKLHSPHPHQTCSQMQTNHFLVHWWTTLEKNLAVSDLMRNGTIYTKHVCCILWVT